MNIQVFGLLHLDENQKTAMNFSTANFREQILVYVNNAKVLSNSLALNGISYTILTNNRSLIQNIASANDQTSLEVIEIPFSTKIPDGTQFYSAHYKLDALRYLASLSSGYYALCDLDMVCINGFPSCLNNLINSGIPLCYDISDQVIPAHGHDVIIRDLSAINGLESEGRWSGGEFISGTPEFFARLVKEIDGIYENYISNISSLHHVGDEAFTSAALECLRRSGVYIADAGTLGIVGRYWNTYVLHPQKPFDYFKKCFLLHLPADKIFLSDLAQRDMEALSQFKVLYARHQRSVLTKLKKVALFSRHFLKVLPNKLLQRTAKRRG